MYRSSVADAAFRARRSSLWCAAALAVALAFCPKLIQAREATPLAEWESPRLTGVNNLPPHAAMVICPDIATAKRIQFVASSERAKSSFYRSLNGDWKYHYASNQLARVPDFWKSDFNDRSWETIPVPSNVELSGHGIPIFVSSHVPWNKRLIPPLVPGDDPNNSVNAYRYNFEVPKAWAGRRVLITFDGVSSFFDLWINGEKVGAGKDGRTPVEFDITKFLKSGNNLLAVENFRWSDGSYLEDQHRWQLSGIFRDVYLWSPPDVHIRDFEVKTIDIEPAASIAGLEVKTEIENLRDAAGSASPSTLEATLFDPDGQSISTSSLAIAVPQHSEREVKFVMNVHNPRLWTAETPHLYNLLLTLKCTNGSVCEVVPVNVGLRTVEIRNGDLLVNNQRVLIKGVNRHEFDPDHGEAITSDLMELDIKMMKRFNFNAVRCAHYPDQSIWYDLCDKYGLYVVDEANTEGNGDITLAKKPEWSDAFMDRTRRMVERDKNHPSVIIWSLGNEAGDGPNLEAACAWIHQRDSGRPVQHDSTEAKPITDTDITCPTFPNPRRLKEYVLWPETRPFIMSEYEYARGNSGGDLAVYWDQIYGKPHLQGGFIAGWIDQGLRLPQETLPAAHYKKPGWFTKTFWAFGGDFGPTDTPSDGNYFCNGLLTPDRQPHPALFEVKHVYQYIHCQPVDLAARTISIENRFDFTNLKDIAVGQWHLKADGVEIQSGDLPDLDIAPGVTNRITIPVKPFQSQPGAEYFLELTFALKHHQQWAGAGYEIAWDEFKLPDSTPLPSIALGEFPPVHWTADTNGATVSGKDFAITFDEASGGIKSWRYLGQELIQSPLRPDFWRAMTDNDRSRTKPADSQTFWRYAGKAGVNEGFSGEKKDGYFEVKATCSLPAAADSSWETIYRIYGSGDVVVTATFEPSRTNLVRMPRVGMQMELPKGFERITWLGPGPQETYCDRKDAPVGVYSGSVDDQFFADYSEPGETGNKTDVRWIALQNHRGIGLLAVGMPLLSANALHYTAEDLGAGKHPFEVPRRDFISLNLDLKQQGVGGDSWDPWPHNEFLIPVKDYTYSFRLRPFGRGEDPRKLARISFDSNAENANSSVASRIK